MGIEIEKKYRLAAVQAEQLRQRLREVGAQACGVEFEENLLYAGGALDAGEQVLRIRRVGKRAILTYKKRFPTDSPIKHQREDETAIEDAEALAAILDALGFTPALVYEKRRETWRVAGVEVAIDELPFGLFAEIEGDENSIHAAEQLLYLTEIEAEHDSYPRLTKRHGTRRGELIEARFKVKN